jgi:hypothetical protein
MAEIWHLTEIISSSTYTNLAVASFWLTFSFLVFRFVQNQIESLQIYYRLTTNLLHKISLLTNYILYDNFHRLTIMFQLDNTILFAKINYDII